MPGEMSERIPTPVAPSNTLMGNNGTLARIPFFLTQAQATALLNLFTSSLQGLVPASGGGTTNYLRADGTFAAPPGTATQTYFYEKRGLIPTSLTGTATTASMTISNGVCADSTNATTITGSSLPTWQASNGNAINGCISGTTLSNSTSYHLFICTGGSGTGTFADTSATSPTLPAGYSTSFRRIFSFVTDSSGHVGGGLTGTLTGIETEGGSVTAFYSTAVLDSPGSIGTGTTTQSLISVPTGIRLRIIMAITSPSNFLMVRGPDETAFIPTTTNCDLNGTSATGSTPVITNTLGQVQWRASISSISPAMHMRAYTDFLRP